MSDVDPFMTGYLPILVVDANGAAAQQLADQLRHSGFQSDVATDFPAAHAAVRTRHYGSLVVVADPNRAADLEGLAVLRSKAPGAWLIAIGSTAYPLAKQALFRCGIDSLLVAPFSMEDLISRLSAFARRSRPL